MAFCVLIKRNRKLALLIWIFFMGSTIIFLTGVFGRLDFSIDSGTPTCYYAKARKLIEETKDFLLSLQSRRMVEQRSVGESFWNSRSLQSVQLEILSRSMQVKWFPCSLNQISPSKVFTEESSDVTFVISKSLTLLAALTRCAFSAGVNGSEC